MSSVHDLAVTASIVIEYIVSQYFIAYFSSSLEIGVFSIDRKSLFDVKHNASDTLILFLVAVTFSDLRKLTYLVSLMATTLLFHTRNS